MPRRVAIVDRELLAHLGFTDHAVERFAQRTGLATGRRGAVEPVMRDLLLQEGRIVTRQPTWARSRNEADLYLQVGDWLLLVCRGSRRRLGSFDAVTVLTRSKATWPVALERGLLGTPPPFAQPCPRRRRTGWRESVVAGLAVRRAAGGRAGRLRAIRAARRELRRTRGAEHAAALATWEDARREHAEQRTRAHAAHVRRHG